MIVTIIKIFTAFTQNYLVDWTLCLQKDVVIAKLYDAGVEILFNLDVLRSLNDNDNSLFDSLQAAPLSVLPNLFLSFVLATKRLRGALFGQSSSQQSIGGLDDVRAAATRFYVSSQRLVAFKKMGTESWKAQLDLLRVVKDQALFTGQQELRDAFRVIIDYAIKALKHYSIAGMSSESLCRPILMISEENQQLEASLAIETMSVIASIEYDVISPFLSRTLFRVLLVGIQLMLKYKQLIHSQISSNEASYGALLENLVEYHSKTRTMNSLLEIILHDMPLRDLVTPHEDAKEVYINVMSSPLMRPAFLDRLGGCTETFITSTQVIPTLEMIAAAVTHTSDEATVSQDALASYMKALKKNTITDTSKDSVYASESSAIALSLTCRIAGVVLVSIEHENLAQEVRGRFQELVRQLHDKISAALSSQMKFLNKWGATGSEQLWGSSMIASALLRLTFLLRRRFVSLRDAAEPKMTSRLLEFITEKDRSTLFAELTFEVVSVCLTRWLSS